jgi:hypothetical protein
VYRSQKVDITYSVDTVSAAVDLKLVVDLLIVADDAGFTVLQDQSSVLKGPDLRCSSWWGFLRRTLRWTRRTCSFLSGCGEK